MDNEKTTYVLNAEQRVRSYYDERAFEYDKYLHRRMYYYERLVKILRHLLPKPGRVLEIGCGLGQNLAGLRPDYGVGIDVSERMIESAQKRYPASEFRYLEFKRMSAAKCGSLNTAFDSVIFVNSLTEIADPVEALKQVRTLCTFRTRLVQLSYSFLWEPILKAGGAVGLCQRHPVQNWLSRSDYANMLKLGGFEMVREGYELLLPIGIPLLSDFVNRFGTLLPGIRALSMMYYSVIRPLIPPGKPEDFSVSVCVPCKNEVGNIHGLVERIPEMGKGTEIIFVDDKSTDATPALVQREIEANPSKNIKLVSGPGQGKGAACRAGFAVAQNDILMILDADMTVMPEALPEFLEAIAAGSGEFINGSRLVYPLDQNAMRLANVFGNKLFALLFSMLLSQRIKDTLCGTKVMWRADYEKILKSREHFGGVDLWGDYDWIFGAARHNLSIIELPVHYRDRVEGTTKMTKRLRNAMVMLRMCGIAFSKVKLIR